MKKVIYTLPLIMSCGSPSSLDDLTKEELIKYITILLKTERHRISKLSHPTSIGFSVSWWPKEKQEWTFSELINQSAVEDNKTLKNLIQRCYQHHKAGALIGLSAFIGKPKSEIFAIASNKRYPEAQTDIVGPNGRVVLTCASYDLFFGKAAGRLPLSSYVSEKQCAMRKKTSTDSNASISQSANTDENLKVKVALEKVKSLRQPKVLLKRLDASLSEDKKVISGCTSNNPSQRRISIGPRTPDSGYAASANGSFSAFSSEANSFFEAEPEICNKIPKEEFLASLGLVDKSIIAQTTTSDKCDETLQLPDVENEKRCKKVQINGLWKAKNVRPKSNRILLRNFIRENRCLPVTSPFVQRLVHKYDFLSNAEKTLLTKRNEKYCKTTKSIHTTSTKCIKRAAAIITRKKNIIADDKSHYYVFTKSERLTRNTEIVIGLKAKSFSSLNKCKQVSVILDKLTPDQISRATKRKPKTWGFMKNMKAFQPTVRLKDVGHLKIATAPQPA